MPPDCKQIGTMPLAAPVFPCFNHQRRPQPGGLRVAFPSCRLKQPAGPAETAYRRALADPRMTSSDCTVFLWMCAPKPADPGRIAADIPNKTKIVIQEREKTSCRKGFVFFPPVLGRWASQDNRLRTKRWAKIVARGGFSMDVHTKTPCYSAIKRSFSHFILAYKCVKAKYTTIFCIDESTTMVCIWYAFGRGMLKRLTSYTCAARLFHLHLRHLAV